ncbi:uncharacterized protein DEA37_0009260, partial [Paragonimus westermani]
MTTGLRRHTSPCIELESDPGKLQAAQRIDTTIRVVIDRLLSGGQPPEDEVNAELKAFRMHRSHLRLNSAGILTRQLREGINVPVIPAELRAAIVKECHQLAHTGCHRTYEMLKQRAHWPGMKNDVNNHVRACQQCQLVKSTNHPSEYPTQPIPARCAAVMKHIVAIHGIPRSILTDQGPCFESEQFRNCLQRLGIKKIRTTPYHPQSNGLTERNNCTIKEWLAAKEGSWEETLPLILLAHRCSPQGTTKKSPFELMYGRVPRLPMKQATIRKFSSIRSTPLAPAELGGTKKSVPGPTSPWHFISLLLFSTLRRPLSVDTTTKAGIYLCISAGGSLIFDFIRAPPSYFSNKYNVFNQLFVKWGWGWTCSGLSAFLIFSSFVYTGRNVALMRAHITRIVTGTVRIKLIAPTEEPTDWVSRIAITSRKSGDIRLRIDPKLLSIKQRAISKSPNAESPTNERRSKETRPDTAVVITYRPGRLPVSSVVGPSK